MVVLFQKLEGRKTNYGARKGYWRARAAKSGRGASSEYCLIFMARRQQREEKENAKRSITHTLSFPALSERLFLPLSEEMVETSTTDAPEEDSITVPFADSATVHTPTPSLQCLLTNGTQRTALSELPCTRPATAQVRDGAGRRARHCAGDRAQACCPRGSRRRRRLLSLSPSLFVCFFFSHLFPFNRNR